MSVWRQKALQTAPELRADFQDPDLSPYMVFSEFRHLLKIAHENNDLPRIEQIYQYAGWCLNQADNEIILTQLPQWLKKDIYLKVRDLLVHGLSGDQIKILDRQYDITR